MIENAHAFVLEAILAKRDGGEMRDETIRGLVHDITTGAATDARIASWLMAVYQRGLTPRELATLTDAMRHSGEVFNAHGLDKFVADKHSTGGVGDKTSLLIAPVAAAAGLAVPMISGRSLGHTGGTLDKMETIPGYRTDLSLARFREVIETVGASMIGQTKELAPADRILYALRDHTGTVERAELICASIMSKKLAEDLDGLVLDVKTGSGAFMRRVEDSEHLAQLMVETGERAGTKTVAVMTAMDEPIGRFAGNWVEVWECVEILRGVAHPYYAETIELSAVLAGWMLFLGGIRDSADAGRERALELLRDGSAYRSFVEMVKLHGGDPAPLEDPAALHNPAVTGQLRAWADGYLSKMDCTQIGWAVQRLGAGREKPGEPVSAHAGLEMHAKLGDRVKKGDVLVTLFADDQERLETADQMLCDAMEIGETQPQKQPLVRKIITK